MRHQKNPLRQSNHKSRLLKWAGVFVTAFMLVSTVSVGAFALEDVSQGDVSLPESQSDFSSSSSSAPAESAASSTSESAVASSSQSAPSSVSEPQSQSLPAEDSSLVSQSGEPESSLEDSSSSELEADALLEDPEADALLWKEGDPIADFASLQQAVAVFNSGQQDMTLTLEQDIVLDSTLTIGPSAYTLTFASAEAPRSLLVQSDIRHIKLTSAKMDFGNVVVTRAPGYRGVGQFGGGLYVEGTSAMLGGTISGNISYTAARNEGLGGGVYVAPYSNFTLSGGQISENLAFRGAGGGVFVGSSAVFTMSGGTVSQNKSNNGAGLFALGGTINLQGNAQVTGNTTDTGDGGGVFLMHTYPSPQTGKLNMEGNAVISGNSAVDDVPRGGGIFSNSGTITIKDNASVVGNSAIDHPLYGKGGGGGGGIFIMGDKNGKLVMSGNSQVSGNHAESRVGTSYGGGIAAGYENQILLSGVTVSGNAAQGLESFGGGIYGHFIVLDNAKILNNASQGTKNGNSGRAGGVWSDDTLTIQSSTISGNTANGGGGGAIAYKLLLDGSTISSNTAGGNGGGLYVITSLSMGSNEITSNTSGGKGGGIHAQSYTQLSLKTGATVSFSGNVASSLYQASSLPAGLAPWLGTVSSISPNFSGDKNILVFNNFDITYTDGGAVSFYRVTYHGEGATGGTAPVDTGGNAIPGSNQYLPGGTATVQGNPGGLSKPGYDFAGWATAPGQSEVQYQQGDLIENMQADVLLYPVWKVLSYAIRYDLAGGVVVTPLPPRYTAEDLPLSIGQPARAGYTFAGWTSESGTLFPEPVAEASIPSGTTGELSLLANWSPKGGYAVHYDTSGGTPGTLASKTEVYWDESGLLPAQAPEKEGYDFLGWHLLSGDEKTVAESTHTYADLAENDGTMSITLVAQWRQRSYTVEFLDWNDTVLKTQQVLHGDGATAPAAPKREGHQFTKWSLDFSKVTKDLAVVAQYTKLPAESPSGWSPSSSSSAPSSSSSAPSSSSSAPSSSSSAPSSSSSAPSSSSAAPSSSSSASSSSSSVVPSSSSGSTAPSSSLSAASYVEDPTPPVGGISNDPPAKPPVDSPPSNWTGGGGALTALPEATQQIEAQEGHGLFENIFSGNVPLFGFSLQNTWSVFSLLFALAGVVTLAVTVVRWAIRRKKSPGTRGETPAGKGMIVLRSIAATASVVPFLLFFAMEDLTRPLVYINQTTSVFLALLLVNVGVLAAIAVIKRKKRTTEPAV